MEKYGLESHWNLRWGGMWMLGEMENANNHGMVRLLLMFLMEGLSCSHLNNHMAQKMSILSTTRCIAECSSSSRIPGITNSLVCHVTLRRRMISQNITKLNFFPPWESEDIESDLTSISKIRVPWPPLQLRVEITFSIYYYTFDQYYNPADTNN